MDAGELLADSQEVSTTLGKNRRSVVRLRESVRASADLLASPVCSLLSYVTVLLNDRSGSRLLETVCEFGGSDVVCALFTCHMAGKLLQLSQMAIANFCVQHLLQSVRAAWGAAGRHLLRDAFEELSPNLEVLCSQFRCLARAWSPSLGVLCICCSRCCRACFLPVQPPVALVWF